MNGVGGVTWGEPDAPGIKAHPLSELPLLALGDPGLPAGGPGPGNHTEGHRTLQFVEGRGWD